MQRPYSASPGGRRNLRVGRGKGQDKQLEIERIIGNSVTSSPSVTVNSVTGDIAYPAGSVIVIYNQRRNKQISFLSTKSNKNISCLLFSPSGKYLAAGESGHQPAIVVWDLSTSTVVAELKNHKFGVSCLAFSPNMKYLASVGYQHDGFVYVWDWRQGTLVACNKIGTKVFGMNFSDDGSYFVTAGYRHIKYWMLTPSGDLPKNEKSRLTSAPTATIIDGRPGILGKHKEASFVDIAGGRGMSGPNSYAVTSQGVLCQFGANRIMEKWVELKVSRAFSVCVSDRYVACACSDGIVRLFDPVSLEYVATLPRPPPLGADATPGKDMPLRKTYPDAISCKISTDSTRLFCFYSDRSMFVWDLKDPKKIGKYRSALAHSGCIWDLQMVETDVDSGAFITCSADSTIRMWDLDPNATPRGVGESQNIRNIFCKELRWMVHTGDDLSSMKADPDDIPSAEKRNSGGDGGIRCIRLSPDGAHLACGDRQGNLRVYNTETLDQVTYQEAHDSEILALDYASTEEGETFLASGSRDRLIHVFNVQKAYDLEHTLDEHSSSITAVKFAVKGEKLLSCGADKSVVFREVGKKNEDRFTRYQNALVPYGTIYDMDVDPGNKFVVTAGQDKKINVWNMQGKSSRSFRAEQDAGEPIKVQLDPSGTLMATSNSDKCIRIFDFNSGDCVAKALGHSEVVTRVRFSTNFEKLVSVSADGCIFVWKLPEDLSKHMKLRMGGKENVSPPPASRPSPSRPLATTDEADETSKDENRSAPPSPPSSWAKPRVDIAKHVDSLNDILDESIEKGEIGAELSPSPRPKTAPAVPAPAAGGESPVVISAEAMAIADAASEAGFFHLRETLMPSWAKSKVTPAVSRARSKTGGGLFATTSAANAAEEVNPRSRWQRDPDGRFKLFAADEDGANEEEGDKRAPGKGREEDDIMCTSDVDESDEEEVKVYYPEGQTTDVEAKGSFEVAEKKEDSSNDQRKDQEEEEFEDPKLSEEMSEPPMQPAEDFVKENFENLDCSTPKALKAKHAENPLRTSISTRYLSRSKSRVPTFAEAEQKVAEKEDDKQPAQTEKAPVKGGDESEKGKEKDDKEPEFKSLQAERAELRLKQRQEKTQEEVLKFRQRLETLGIKVKGKDGKGDREDIKTNDDKAADPEPPADSVPEAKKAEHVQEPVSNVDDCDDDELVGGAMEASVVSAPSKPTKTESPVQSKPSPAATSAAAELTSMSVDSDTSKSVPVADAISSLTASFDVAMDLFSSTSGAEKGELEAALLGMSERLAQVLNKNSSVISTSALDESNMTINSQVDVSVAIEKYSDMLVTMVKEKMKL